MHLSRDQSKAFAWKAFDANAMRHGPGIRRARKPSRWITRRLRRPADSRPRCRSQARLRLGLRHRGGCGLQRLIGGQQRFADLQPVLVEAGEERVDAAVEGTVVVGRDNSFRPIRRRCR